MTDMGNNTICPGHYAYIIVYITIDILYYIYRYLIFFMKYMYIESSLNSTLN
jgi:hypothetical protein